MALYLELKNNTHGRLAHEISPKPRSLAASFSTSPKRPTCKGSQFDNSVQRITLVST
jgi:hypothetical protein